MPQELTPYEKARARLAARRGTAPPRRSTWDTIKDYGSGVAKFGTDLYDQVEEVGREGAKDIKEGNYPRAFGRVVDPIMAPFHLKGAPEAAASKGREAAMHGAELVGIPATSIKDEWQSGHKAKAAGEATTAVALAALGARAMRGKPKAPAPKAAPPPARSPLLLPERASGTRFYAGEAGVADAHQTYRRHTGNPNPMIESGTPTLSDVGEVVTLPPELAAQGYGPQGAPPISVGKQRTRAAQSVRAGLEGDKARKPRLAPQIGGRERLEMDVEAVGGNGFPDRGPARQSPGTPSVEHLPPQRPREAYYPKEDPNVPGLHDVDPIAQEGPREIRLPAGHQSALRKMGIPEENIRSMTIEQADKVLKATGKPAPKAPPVARLTTKKNSQGQPVQPLAEGPMAAPAAQVAADLKAGTQVGRPYRMLSQKDLETLGSRGDNAAVKELIGRRRGEYTQYKPGDVDPSRPADSSRGTLGNERGSVNVKDAFDAAKDALSFAGRKLAPGASSLNKIDFDKPLPGGGGKGNILHRTVNPVFDRNYENWVNARRATKVEGLIKRREFADLDAAGFEGINQFQAGLKTGRFKDVGDYFNAKHDELSQAGVKLGFRENYLPQLWENTADEVFAVQKRLGLQPSFSLDRVLENYQKGLEQGLKPKYKTVGELMGWYESRANKAIADRQFFDHLRETKQILPDGKAPSEWKTIDPDHFPVQKFKTKRGEHVTKNYKAPPAIATAINNYLGEGHEAFRFIGDKASITKNIVLSSGVAGTGINAHGFNIAARNVMAQGVLKGGVEAAKYLLKPGGAKITKNPLTWVGGALEKLPWESAKDWMDAHIAMAPDAVKHGLTLTTEEHQYGTTGSTHLLREPKTRPGKVLNKGFNWMLSQHGKFFEDPLFQNVVPALKLKHWNALAEDLRKTGLSIEDAKRGAANTTNELYGGINWEAMQRSRDLQNLMRGIILAPDWFESQYRIGKGMTNTTRDPFNPRGLPYKRMAVNLLASYVAADVINYSINGEHMWDNDPGHALDIKAGTTGGKIRYIRPFGTAADFARLPFDAIMGLKQGDLSTTSTILKNRRSTVAKAGSNLLMNQDDFGKPIFGDDMYGRKTPITTQLGKAGREVASVMTPQYVKGGIDYATGRATSKEEALLGSVELPVRYARKSTKQVSRNRPSRRRTR